MIKYKKDLRAFYQENIEHAKDADQQSRRENEAKTYLPSMYLTNLPLSLSDHYDTREPESARQERTVNQGDPISIIINKVHLADNGELLCGNKVCPDTAEIGVVVTVDDGRQDEPKNVLVSYDEGLKPNIDLPMANLLAYATTSYDNQPIRITVTVFEFDQLENQNFKKVLSTAAGIGATLTPAYAPAWSLATEIGNFLINQQKDNILVTFTFQLYPRRIPSKETVIGDLGKPPIHEGSYIVINTDHAPTWEVNKHIHLDFGFNAFTINPKEPANGEPIVDANHHLKRWPLELPPSDDRSPFNENYLVMTVAKSPIHSSAMIIERLDALNRKATGLSKLEARSQAGAALLGRDLDDLRSAITWFFAEGEYASKKTDPRALAEVFRLATDPRLNDADQRKAKDLIDRSLPAMTDIFKNANRIVTKEQEANLDNIKKWYDIVKTNAEYDSAKGRLACKDAGGKEQPCQ